MRIIKQLAFSLLVFVFIGSVFAAAVFAVSADEQQKGVSEEQQKMMKLWKEYTSPGENHKHLAYFVGDWESVQKFWQEGAEPIERKQKIHVESLFGGRFTKAHIKIIGEVMGKSVEGYVFTGHDNYKKRFESVTFTNVGTDFSHMHGTLDETGKIRTDFGQDEDAFTGQKVKLKAITTIIDKDKYTYDYYQIDPQGKEVKVMTITYYRKK